MKNLLTISLLSTLSAVSATAFAQPSDPQPQPQPQPTEPASCDPCRPGQPATVPTPTAAAYQQPYAQPSAALAPQQEPAGQDADAQDEGEGWHRPAGRRFFHGFRLGWTYVSNYDKPTRDNNMSLKDEFKLKTPNMMLLGYEGFYRIVGHSWLNVLMVGNVTVAGLEQSKFIPAASGLIGFEIDRSFQLGVGVNLTPDPQAPSHMIAAAGWTPRVGAIQTPVHFFYVPDASGNNRMGATVGMNW